MTPTTRAKLTKFFVLAWYAHETGHEDAALTYQSWWVSLLQSPWHSVVLNRRWQ